MTLFHSRSTGKPTEKTTGKSIAGTVSKNSGKTSFIAKIALLTAAALIFSYIEAIIPFNIGIPGVKLGIANLVIIIALYSLDLKCAFLINILRIFLSGFLFSGVFAILYSLAGGILSLILMALLKYSDKFSIIGVSVAGGVSHNFAQLITAAFVMGTSGIFGYFPVLLFSGIICGIIIGITAYLILRRLDPKML